MGWLAHDQDLDVCVGAPSGPTSTTALPGAPRGWTLRSYYAKRPFVYILVVADINAPFIK
jgi:hypothetical protein